MKNRAVTGTLSGGGAAFFCTEGEIRPVAAVASLSQDGRRRCSLRDV